MLYIQFYRVQWPYIITPNIRLQGTSWTHVMSSEEGKHIGLTPKFEVCFPLINQSWQGQAQKILCTSIEQTEQAKLCMIAGHSSHRLESLKKIHRSPNLHTKRAKFLAYPQSYSRTQFWASTNALLAQHRKIARRRHGKKGHVERPEQGDLGG